MTLSERFFGKSSRDGQPGFKSQFGQALEGYFGTSGRDGQPGTPSIFREPFMGRPGEMLQTSTKTPQQTEFMNQQLNQASGLLDPKASEAYARSQYQQQGIPSIMQRFRGSAGQTGASSGLLSALSGGAANLESQLSGQRFGQGQGLAQMGLGQQFENTYRPKETGLLEALAPMLAQAGLGYATGGASLAASPLLAMLQKLLEGTAAPGTAPGTGTPGTGV